MPRNKANNQYYGKYTECCVVANLNGEDVVYNENYDEFTEKEKINMFNDGKIIAEYLGDHTATYCGNHTGTAAEKLILDMDFNALAERNTATPGFGKGDFVSYYSELKK